MAFKELSRPGAVNLHPELQSRFAQLDRLKAEVEGQHLTAAEQATMMASLRDGMPKSFEGGPTPARGTDSPNAANGQPCRSQNGER